MKRYLPKRRLTRVKSRRIKTKSTSSRARHGRGTRRVSKVKIGGTKVIFTANRFVEMVNFIKEITIDSNIEHEICGTFEKHQSGYIVKQHEVDSIPGESRKHCRYEYHNKFIWHSHPTSSKFFPSLEDILKIIKHARIEYSYIFTTFGFWTLRSIEHIEIDDSLRERIDEMLTMLYHTTSRGREYNAESVATFISKINELLGGILEISFTPYSLLTHSR